MRSVLRKIKTKKGYIEKGKLRIFLAVKNVNWEKTGLVDSWNGIGELIHYDLSEKYNQYSVNWYKRDMKLFNNELLDNIENENKKKQINIFFYNCE